MSTARSRPPPAPSKTRSTRTTRAATYPDEDDALSSNLAQLSLTKRPEAFTTRTSTAESSTRRPTAATRPLGRSAAANRPLPPTRSTSPSAAPSQPAKRAATTRPPAQTTTKNEKSSAERAKEAMAALNNALAALSAANKGGFRASSIDPSSSTSRPGSAASSVRGQASSASLRAQAGQGAAKEKVEQAAGQASKALRELRTLVAEGTLARKKIEVEKAGGSVVSGLVEMEMYRLALSELSVMRASLLSWWTPALPSPLPPPSASSLAHLSSFLLPLPPASFLAPLSLSETLSSSAAPPRPTLAEVVPLVLAIQQYLLGCLFRLSASSPSSVPLTELASALFALPLDVGGSGGPLEWRALLEAEATKGEQGTAGLEAMGEKKRGALVKRLDAMMTSLFGTVTKGLSGADGVVVVKLNGDHADAEVLLILRTYALLCYSTLSPLSSSPSPIVSSCRSPTLASPSPPPADKLCAFYDQLRKILLLYGRSAEALGRSEREIGEKVKDAFESVVKECERRGVTGTRDGKEGAKWRELGDVVLHIARRANDRPFVERVSALLGLSSLPTPPSQETTDELLADPYSSASHLCSKLLNALSSFETSASSSSSSSSSSTSFSSTSEPVSALHCLSDLVPSLTRLRLLPSPSRLDHSTRTKIDKTLDRARYVLVKHLKGGRRIEGLMTPQGGTMNEVDETGRAVREAVDKLAVHSARVVAALRERTAEVMMTTESEVEEDLEAEKKVTRDLVTTAVDSLLTLAYSSMAVDDRSSHSTSFAYLERCLPLIGFPSPSSASPMDNLVDLDLHYSLRTLSSGYYNLGGSLFNASQPEAAVRFVKRACDVASAAWNAGRKEGMVGQVEAGEGGDGMVEVLGRLNLGAGKPENDRKEEKDKREAVRDMERLMSRRWELLALSAHAIGDKKTAHSAYLSALVSQPSSVLRTLSSSTAQLPPYALCLAPSAPHAELYKLAQRATRIGVFDLLLPPTEIPLVHGQEAQRLEREVQGVLLEMQLGALLSYGVEKVESSKAALAILDACLDGVYEAEGEMPLRRARVLVAKMAVTSSCASTVVGGEEMRRLGKEVEELCGRECFDRDSALASYAPQILALSHLFLAVSAHQHPSSSSSPDTAVVVSSDLVASEARQALNILRNALEGAGEVPPSPTAPTTAKYASPAAKTVAFQSPVKVSPPRPAPAQPVPAAPATRTRRAATSRTAPPPAANTRPTRSTATSNLCASTTRRAARAASVAPVQQVTPPRPKRGQFRLQDEDEERSNSKEQTASPVAAKPLVKSGTQGETAGAKVDDGEKAYALFETMAHLLGTLGYQLLKIAFLRFLRRLSSLLPSASSAPYNSPLVSGDAFVLSSSLLGHEYLRLGKTARAGYIFAQVEGRIQQGGVREQAQCEYYLRYAEYLAMLGNHERAAQAYDSALHLAKELDKESLPASASTVAKVVERTLLLKRTALAASVCSVMLQRKGELSRSLAPAMQAMRLGTRALNNISRLAPAPLKDSSTTGSTFNAPPPDHKTPLADAAPINHRKASSTALPGGAVAGLSWQLAEALFDSTLRVASLHFTRGTPKSAEFYAQQALDLAEDLGSARCMARALALRADVRMHWTRLEEAEADLSRLDVLVGSASCPEATDARRLRADLHVRASMHTEAYQLYLDAQHSLEAFVSRTTEVDGHSPNRQQTPAKHRSPGQARSGYFTHPSPSPSALRTATPLDLVLPAVHAYLLRMQVHLLRTQRNSDEMHRLLRRLSKLAALEEDKADELKLRAALQIQDLLVRCSSDPILGMLSDSVLSMPALGIAAAGAVIKIGTPRTGPTVLNSLKDIETLLARAIGFSASRSQPNKLRELALVSATMRTLQASVGKATKRSTASLAHTLELASAVTLRREMLDAIEHKLLLSSRQDDLNWPATALPPPPSSDNRADIHLYHLHERYRAETAEPILTDSSMSSLLPQCWSAISIHLTPEHDSLILVRHRRSCEPLLFKLPLDRLARRDGEEDEAFTYEVALSELKDIINLSNEGTQQAKHVDGREERAAWWAARKELDQRLQTLLQTMEDAWLGAFKSLFYDSRKIAAEDLAAFKTRFERILKRSIVRAAGEKRTARFKLDDAIVECLAALPSASREEDLEDLFYYAAESFHFSGVPLAHDETDVDQVVVDLREALEELHGTKSAPKRSIDPDEHTFLVLDKTLQAFPWESLPCLRGRSTSRLPSLAFLRDRLDLAAAASTSSDQPQAVVVDHSKASFVLNPGGDLKNTQNTFEPWLTAQGAWTGVVARTPLEEEIKAALAQKELFLYFGHGGAEQYIRSQTIRHLPRCAVTMLWGCSSGMLKEQGDFDPVGTPNHYMVAGCPALVANLWDVTDKDIDKLAFAVFRKTGIAEPEPLASPPETVSLTSAIASSRDECNLRYLNGAAPVVYGIPVRFSSSS
ncbi:hypothetical protein JCM11251_001054 [Rhodosporidiobolus azoricus]